MKRTSPFLPAVATTWLCFAAIDAQSQEDEVATPAPCDRIRCYQPGPIPLTLDDGSEASFELQVAALARSLARMPASELRPGRPAHALLTELAATLGSLTGK